MTAEMPDVETLVPKKSLEYRKKPMSPRKLCFLNTCAVFVVIALIILIILKMVFGVHPGIFYLCGTKNQSFVISGNHFLKDGKPFQYISGSIHYSRVLPSYWRDRLHKMRYAGLDAVQIYVPWNFHQPTPDQSLWTGSRDLVKFLKIAQEEDLLVILRAGPYICAEWDFGGLPAWLLQKNASMIIRSSDPSYMKWVNLWMTELLTKVKPYLYSAGGPIIMVQLENEYGSYPTCDKKYLSSLYDLGRRTLGNDVIIFSTDGNSAGFLKCGAMEKRVFATVDFGTGSAMKPKQAFSALRKIQPSGPLVNSEYYVGWLDVWGSRHAHVAVKPILQGLTSLYKYNASVNMYMFFGGTNFGFWNGAEGGPYTPQVTSYDYDAPLSEAGDMTWKYQALRQTICNLKGNCPPPSPPALTNATIYPYGRVQMKPLCHFVSLLPSYPNSSAAGQPLGSMESHGVYQGYAVYSAYVALKAGTRTLTLPIVRDAAYVFTSDATYRTVVYHGVVRRDAKTKQVAVTTSADDGDFLHILVENGGHINYGGGMQGDAKGLFGSVALGTSVIKTWNFFELDVTKDSSKFYSCDPNGHPSQGMFYGTFGETFFSKGPNDTFMMPTSFKKGQFLMNFDNGYFNNIGRYWPAKGPQKTLYVPKNFVHLGLNAIRLFEVEGVNGTCPTNCYIDFFSQAQLGDTSTFATTPACGRHRCL